MKILNKLILILFILGATSCEMTELDLLDNPNAVTEENASVDDLYNSVQLNFFQAYFSSWGLTAPLVRMIDAGAFTYVDFRNPNSYNGLWNAAYAELFPDINALLNLAEERGLDIHAGTAKIMKAVILTELVDIFGNVPNSEALQGTDIISPVADNGADVYAAANALLDEAIAQLSGSTAAKPAVDLFYGGDAAKWVTAAKTYKLRNAVTTRLVDPGASTSTINALIAEGDLIDMKSEDFQVQAGSQRSNPNSRHPFYNNAYETSDATYMANYYMWLLRAEKMDGGGNTIVDPRIRYYFYRQVKDAANQNANVYACHWSQFPDQSLKPDWFTAVDPRLPYCIAAEDGYYGRDHLNGEGIPPDGPIRTVYGIYPGGGLFDANTFRFTQNSGTDGALGQGILPILLSSFADFMRAEAALTLGTNDDPREMLERGVTKSIDKVQSFSATYIDVNEVVSEDAQGNPVTVSRFIPDEDDVRDYIDFVLSQYDAATTDEERLNIIIKEYFIALWGNGLEAYNAYRRTGMPKGIQPALESAPGPFVRTGFLPADHVTRNANASQKELTVPVFWDTNPQGLTY